MKRWHPVLLLAACLLAGCGGHRNVLDLPAPADNDSVRLLTGDTLRFVVGDSSAFTGGYAEVWNSDRQPVSGLIVTITNAHPELGYVTYTDPLRGDTSDYHGRVGFRYYGLGPAGHDTLCARSMTLMDCARLVLAPLAVPPPAGMTLIPDTIYSPWDSVLVVSCGDSSLHQGVISIGATGGRFELGVAPDSNGCSFARWYCNNSGFGQFCIRWGAYSACVMVLDSTAGG
jgi:hypothetical protein